MWDIDWSDTDLVFLDTDIPGKHFVCLQDVLKTYTEDVLKIYLEDVLKTCLQGVFKTCLQCKNFSSSKTSSRRLCKTSWKTKNCYAEGVLKTSSRHVLKTSSRLLEDQQMFAEVVNISISSKILDSQHALVTWLSEVLISKKVFKNIYG